MVGDHQNDTFLYENRCANKILNYSRPEKLSWGSEMVRWRDDVTFKWTNIILKGFWGGKQQNLIKVQIDSIKYVLTKEFFFCENFIQTRENKLFELSTTFRQMN